MTHSRNAICLVLFFSLEAKSLKITLFFPCLLEGMELIGKKECSNRNLPNTQTKLDALLITFSNLLKNQRTTLRIAPRCSHRDQHGELLPVLERLQKWPTSLENPFCPALKRISSLNYSQLPYFHNWLSCGKIFIAESKN